MRKVYVLYGWTPENETYVSGIYTSRKKAEHAKNVLDKAKTERSENRIYNIETEVLL